MMSEDISKLAEALAKAQGMMKFAKEDSANPFFKSSYADLASVWSACREALSSNGLSVSQIVDNNGEKGTLVTILMHASGQWMKSVMNLMPKQMDAQGIGSAITYARRYALAAIVGVSPGEDDDDGEGAMGRDKKASNGILNGANLIISAAQCTELTKLINGDKALMERMLKHYNIPSLIQLPQEKFRECLEKTHISVQHSLKLAKEKKAQEVVHEIE